MFPDVVGCGLLRSLVRGKQNFDDNDILGVGRDTIAAVGFCYLWRGCVSTSQSRLQVSDEEEGWGLTHIVAGAQRVDRLSVDVWRSQLAIDEHGECLEHTCQDVESGRDGAGVDEGIFEVGIAREELRLQEASIGDILEEGHVYAV